MNKRSETANTFPHKMPKWSTVSGQLRQRNAPPFPTPPHFLLNLIAAALFFFLPIASPVRAISADAHRSPPVQSVANPPNIALPPVYGGAAEWPISEREMAQLAIQELLQLQKEQQRNDEGGQGKEAKRHKNTKILPFSLYEQQMSKIFGEHKKGTNKQQKGHLLSTNTPVVIHLPAYRSTAKGRGGGATAVSARKSIDWSPFGRTETARKSNPIRPQSNRWNSPPAVGEAAEEDQNSGYRTDFLNRKDKSRLSNANRGIAKWTTSSSAEYSLITRPKHMFVPNGHLLRPIEPIDSPQNQKQQQLFIKRVTSAADATTLEGGKRVPPHANSAFASGTALASPSASALSLPSMSSQFVPFSPNSPPSLVGSPFDLMGPSMPNSGAVQSNALLSQLPNPFQLLSQGSTLEQITSLARNLIQMSNGKGDLLTSLSKAIGSPASAADSAASKLTSTAVHSIAKSVSKVAAQTEKTAAPLLGTNGGVETVKTLFSSNETTETEKGQQANGTSSADLLNALPTEQRILLEAAMQNGELDLAQTKRALSGEMNSSKRANADELTAIGKENIGGTTRGKLVNAESRLMEWIQQNRPRPVATVDGKEQHQNGVKTSASAEKSATLSPTVGADKLPYYGKYCGHFVEQANLSKPHNVAGAVWAVDERQLLLSKFHFQPFEQFENITFWAGPAKPTGTSQDFFPNENGIYLSPAKLDAATFAQWPLQKLPARTRAPILPINGRDYYGVNGSSTKGKGRTAEEEEEEEGGGTTHRNGGDGTRETREKRNLYSELYEKMAPPEGKVTPKTEEETTLAPSTTPNSTGTTTEDKSGDAGGGEGSVPVRFDGMPQHFHLSLGGETVKRNQQQKGEEWLRSTDKFGTDKERSNELQNDMATKTAHPFGKGSHWTSLGWHGGINPILITLPENRLIKMLNWLSVWDHVQKQAIALVLLPSPASGAAFQSPSSVQLRPLPALNASAGKRLQSGSIRILDTKTIELTEFSLRMEGLPVWFMVGKEIVPNRNGHIVPIFNRNARTFDCDSLRDFHNETVTLRLPDPLDMKDVFWFSVFSMPRSQSIAHIYIPYNDMQLPPDLLPMPTPQCVWSPPPSPG